MILVIGGVCGSGKTTVGSALAKKLGYEYIDADDYHPIENKNLMKQGKSLNDELRLPWLQILHKLLYKWQTNNTNGVLACSALKAKYRQILKYGHGYEDKSVEGTDLDVKFILLSLDYELATKRLKERSHEFINGTSILDSQFSILEIDSVDKNTCFAYILKLADDKSVEDCVNELKLFIERRKIE